MTTYSEEFIRQQPTAWLRQYYAHKYKDPNAWFWLGRTDLNPSKEEKVIDGGNLDEVVITAKRPVKETMGTYLANNFKRNWEKDGDKLMSNLETAAGFLPYVGDALDVKNIGKDLYNGLYGAALAGIGMLALPNVIEKPLKAGWKFIKRRYLLQKIAKQLNKNIDNTILPGEKTVRLYRGTGTNGQVSPDGGVEQVGQWFTPIKNKTGAYLSNLLAYAKRKGINNPTYLEYVDIPESLLEYYRAKGTLDPKKIEFEEDEDYLIPLNIKRNKIEIPHFTNSQEKLDLHLGKSLPETPFNPSNTSWDTSKHIYYDILPPEIPTTKTPLKFYERPSTLTEAERLGIPKGLERTIINNKEEILNNAKAFAEKYGYEIPETIDAAKAMYNLHNSFFRTPSNHESVILHYDPELVKLPLELLYFKLASKGYPESMRSYDFSQNGIYSDDFVFVAPDYGEVMPYINDVPAVMLRRPFRKSNPLTWHKDAEWTIQSKYTPYDQVFGKNKIGTAQIGNAGPLHEFKVSTRHLQPVKIAEPTDKGTLLGIYLGPYEYKSGGTIKIKKKNRGKFTESAKRAGKSVQEHARDVVNDLKATKLQKRRAQFALNSKKFKHENGGKLNYLNLF